MADYLSVVEGAIELEVLVVPRASRSRIVGEHDGRLKIQLNAPPVDGRANGELVELLAKTFSVKQGKISIVSGETGRRKRVRLEGADPDAARKLLDSL